MTGGMDNPVDVVFTPGGERIFTTTFFQHPGGGKRDGLIHAIYGGVYGKDHDPVYEHPWTSPALMPVLTHLGPAAPCWTAPLRIRRAFGPEYPGQPVRLPVQHAEGHAPRPASRTARPSRRSDEDFLVSDNHDFHPTDVIEDADGSLLVIDTGGWYKLCCPTSQLDKPDVLGRSTAFAGRERAEGRRPARLEARLGEDAAAELALLLGDAQAGGGQAGHRNPGRERRGGGTPCLCDIRVTRRSKRTAMLSGH